MKPAGASATEQHRSHLNVGARPAVCDLIDSDEFNTWLAASCARQNLPVAISDPTTLQRVTKLLG